MQPLTREWVGKVEGDFATARRELRARKAPNYDAACFHAQQCAEKSRKARLQEADIPFGRTHNLPVLLELLLPIEPSWEMLRPHLRVFPLSLSASVILVSPLIEPWLARPWCCAVRCGAIYDGA
jgi:HEPN domain